MLQGTEILLQLSHNRKLHVSTIRRPIEGQIDKDADLLEYNCECATETIPLIRRMRVCPTKKSPLSL